MKWRILVCSFIHALLYSWTSSSHGRIIQVDVVISPQTVQDPVDQWREKWMPGGVCSLCDSWPAPSPVSLEDVIQYFRLCAFSSEDYMKEFFQDCEALSARTNCAVNTLLIYTSAHLVCSLQPDSVLLLMCSSYHIVQGRITRLWVPSHSVWDGCFGEDQGAVISDWLQRHPHHWTACQPHKWFDGCYMVIDWHVECDQPWTSYQRDQIHTWWIWDKCLRMWWYRLGWFHYNQQGMLWGLGS